ncbi:MAG: hypothetical protein LH613_03555 [Chamaesiphon sp.]|nr:hypothetical protein [Chamaesiphon sp.]
MNKTVYQIDLHDLIKPTLHDSAEPTLRDRVSLTRGSIDRDNSIVCRSGLK